MDEASQIELKPDKVFSVIIFDSDSNFKNTMPDNVVYMGGYIRYIKRKTRPIFSDSEVFSHLHKSSIGSVKDIDQNPH